MSLADWARDRPRLALSTLFVLWKSLIFAVAALSPGLGYDTSTNLLLHQHDMSSIIHKTPGAVQNKMLNLVRWDGIYYTQMAQYGLVYEQEWAFGVGISTTNSVITKFIFGDGGRDKFEHYVLTGVVLSHVCHWIAVMLLYSVAKMTLNLPHSTNERVSLVAAALHIVSPAGIFLSATQAEAVFASLNMLGFYLYLKSTQHHGRLTRLASRALAGLIFGAATVMRSNGILGGLLFLVNALDGMRKILSPAQPAFAKPHALLDLQFTVIGGLCIALGLFWPQALAYQDYCVNAELPRPWCTALMPSIFTFVQSHYWNVGFLHYWTLGNLPLFMLAAPVLYLLIRSGFIGCVSSLSTTTTVLPVHARQSLYLALPQLVLALLAIFAYHVQIINRLSSAYPFWYIWLAAMLRETKAINFVRFFVLYALIQASLYASFLPPA